MTDAPPIPLAQAIGFTEADLSANREGKLSQAQCEQLQKRKTRILLIGFGTFLILTLVATLFLFMGSRPNQSGILSIIGIGLTICNALMVGIFFRGWLRLNADSNTNTVIAIQGEVERVLKPLNRRVMNYMIRIQNIEVYVNKDVFIAFAPQGEYTIYRTPYSGILLSAERGKS